MHLLQKCAIRLCHLLIIVWLECQPTLLRTTKLRSGIRSLVIVNQDLLVSSRCSRIREQLRMASLVETDEPEGSLINRASNCQQTVVLQDCCFAVTKSLRYTSPLFSIEYNALEVSIDSMALVETKRVLGQHFQLAAKTRERLAMYTVCVTCSVDVRASLMNLGMDGKGCLVDRLLAFYYDAIFVDQYEIRDFDQCKVH